ncbi:transcription factor grauzone-like [Lutzomyia longipalpis]|uniref:transcription factor grauzone-like n=1 Tax=Lutzomyia longipalpis TaxID=7200 RepID=UPI00248403A9|nr:transcription factor grauzone-like [Lutzomyia longipalpis]
MDVMNCKESSDGSFCRLCFTREGIFRRIHNSADVEGLNSSSIIPQLVEKHLHVEIYEVSYQVCEECCQQLYTFGEFYTKIHEQIDKFLSELQQNVENVKSEYPENCVQENPLDSSNNFDGIDRNSGESDEDTKASFTIEKQEDLPSIPSLEAVAIKKEEPSPQKRPIRSCRTKKNHPSDSSEVKKSTKKEKKRKMSTVAALVKEDPECQPQSLRKSQKSHKKTNEFIEFDFREDDSDSDENSDETGWEECPGGGPINLDKFPNPIIENGLLRVKGKELMGLINKFYSLECNVCEKTKFQTLRDLIEHYNDVHKEKGYVMCCSSKFKTYPAIIMHMARHIQPDAFKCNVCGYMVTRPRFLENHKKTHLPEEEKPFACDHCPRRFCWKTAYQVHQLTHQEKEERKQFVCHICGHSYNTPGGLCTHKKRVHTDSKTEPHVCHICAKKFATRTGLNEHMSTIHQPRERGQLQCQECGKWLMNSRCLKSHMILHSSAIFSCTICDYTTKKKSLLRRHNLTQHSDEKPFVCTICSRAFKLKRALTVHMAQHESTKQYKCNFCERVFNSSTNFYTHRKAAHPEELNALKQAKLEEQRQKRIAAGVEDANPMISDDEAAQGNSLVILPMSPIEHPVDFSTYNQQVHETYHIVDHEGTITAIIQENLASDSMM